MPIEQTAEMIAGEQSSGTFLPLPGETEELRARARAKVLEVERLGTVDSPSLPGARMRADSPIQQARVRIAFPFENIGFNLPTLVTTLCGNIFELAEHSGCKLVDVELPEIYTEYFAGPQFGVQGTRKLVSVFDRPILGTIIKPSVGLTPEQTAAIVSELGEAGIDFIKDDELMANPPHSPLKDRVACVMREILRLEDKVGRKVMYAFNISDDVEAMKRHHDLVRDAGGSCVMVSLNHVGFTGVHALRSWSSMPIHGHRNGWGMLNRHPVLGMDFVAYQKLWRAVGIDHLHVNGLQNKFWEPDDSVVRSIESIKKPMWGGYHMMPVVSSGQWGGQAPATYQAVATLDLLYLAGGGIMAHPLGPSGGLRAIQQAWEAAVKGIPLEQYALDHEELKLSLSKFGKRK